jgi:hypothetical protein
MLSRRIIFHVCGVATSFALSFSFSVQASEPNPKADLGSIELNYAHLPWPTPESLIRSLQADDEQTRIRALVQMGVPKEGLAKIDEKPSEVQLLYASLGTNDQQQAIVAVRMAPMLFGAVAEQEKGVWQRVASFSCWCKYETGDLIGNFVHVEAGPEGGSELVLHASRGGTGVYTQSEARFRYYCGELRLVISFTSRFRSCDPTAPGSTQCHVERRWFYPSNRDSIPGSVLVESHFNFPANSVPGVQAESQDLELSHAKTFSCTVFNWDKEKFVYTESGASSPCKPQPPVP